jgi:excisionase family DNA binding protein
MAENGYRTGQAAKQLGVSSYHVRRLCEAGEIAAEITDGGQWKIPLPEVRRLQKEGVPPIPQRIPGNEEDARPQEYANLNELEGDGEPSAEVTAASNAVKVAGSRLEQRRLERETEQVEDWFRERRQLEIDRETAARQRAEAAQAERRRREWINRWIQYGLNSMPPNAPRETQLEVHASIEQTLAKLQCAESSFTVVQLVGAAVEKALGPWRRIQKRQDAIDYGVNQLAWEARMRPEFSQLKLRAIEAASDAVSRCRSEATAEEMRLAAEQAISPVVREYEHHQVCQRLLEWIHLPGATREDLEQAKATIQRAFSSFPVGTPRKKLEQAKQSVLDKFAVRIAQREKAQRLEAEDQELRQDAERKARAYLGHVERYLSKEYRFDDGPSAMREEARHLRDVILRTLVEDLMDEPDMSGEDIQNRIEELIDEIEDHV